MMVFNEKLKCVGALSEASLRNSTVTFNLSFLSIRHTLKTAFKVYRFFVMDDHQFVLEGLPILITTTPNNDRL